MKKEKEQDRGFKKPDEPCGKVVRESSDSRMELISNLPGEVFY